MNQVPASLQKGDLIAIVAPAKSIEREHVLFAKAFFEKEGFRVEISKNCLGEHHYFSGDEAQRLIDFQSALDNPEVKAIICARGGYGCVQLLDRIQWAAQLREPKWIVGFSDVTYLHQRMQRHEIASIHGTMPLNFQQNSEEALSTLIGCLMGKPSEISWKPNEYNRLGTATGTLVGGNLSILYALLGTDDQIDFENSILYIEDVGEPIYAIDRMFYAFSKAGIFDKIKGLIVGGMTNLSDTAVPFGKCYEEVILSHFDYRKIPIAFNLPAGHIDDNRALILNANVALTASQNTSQLSYL
ncbi:MAG: LD-carboxypeptidase [Crocinitomicaceae bacterium]|nr:LD-carboxypeptidase [Flavobacteriales bacterium]NQZ36589.1 LD-carboxypeptidase [Crocinitomicaceae bacterium]